MPICEASYALGSLSVARSSLATAQRALGRERYQASETVVSPVTVNVDQALAQVENAIHLLGSELAARECHNAVAMGRSDVPASVAKSSARRSSFLAGPIQQRLRRAKT